MKGPTLAIIGDTWRQSKNQLVLLVLILMLMLTIPLFTLTMRVYEAPDGSKFLGMRGSEQGSMQRGFDQGWDGLYADALKQEIGLGETIRDQRVAVADATKALEQADFRVKRLEFQKAPEAAIQAARNSRRDAEIHLDELTGAWRSSMNEERERTDKLLEERTASIDKLQKGVEYWLAQAVTMLFTIAMLGFIAAGAGYVPAMIEAGSIDLVLSKPIRRWQLFFGKYIGGLLLISVALLASYIVIFVGVGLVTGVWHWPFFNALPMTIFSLALLNAIVGWVGLWTRSTSMAMVIGYIYYLVVDTAVGLLSDPAAAPFLNELKGVAELSEFVKLTFPSFKWLRESAEASIFSVWFFPWKHVIVGMIWLVVCLGTAFNRFRINDY